MNIDLLGAETFKFIFEGNPVAHYTWKPGEYSSIDRGISLADVERHLRGEEPGLLSIPILPSGLVHFACGDCDRHKPEDPAIDHPDVARRISELHLPLIITASKSPKSAHIWLFFKDVDGFDAGRARELIRHYMKVLEISGDIEIFPKQEMLKPDQIGSGINLPFFGETRIAFGREGEELSLEEFLALAAKCASFGRRLADSELKDAPSGRRASSADAEDRPISTKRARGIHLDNLEELRTATHERNNTLNKVAFWAGRCFVSKVFGKSEANIKIEIIDAALQSGLSESESHATARSGWESGILKPLTIDEDEFPQRTATLKEFNEKYFVVADLGGKCRVCHEVISEDNGNLVLVHQEFDDLRKAYMHQRIVVDSRTKNVGRGEDAEEIEVLVYKDKANFWLDHPERRQFERVAFAPNETLAPEVKNLWRGFRVEPKQGKIPRFLEHISENICKANQARYDWWMRWQAWKVRNPGLQNGTCPVLIGPEGIGKNVAADAFAFLFGPHAFLATKPEDVVGHFNSHMRACCFLLGNESLYAGNRRDGNVLKTLITERMMSIEGKGIDSRMERNHLSVMLATNEPWAVLAGISARRFSVFDVGTKHLQDHDYFNAIGLELGGSRGTLSGYQALLHHLLFEVELKDFQPQRIILTDALVGQQAQSLRGADALWHAILFRGEMPGGLPGNLLQSERLLKWAQLQHDRKYDGITDRQIGQLLGENTVGEARGMGFQHVKPRPRIDGHRVRAWKIPSLREARARWDELRFVEQWPELEERGPLVLQDSPDPDDWELVPVGDEPKLGLKAAAEAAVAAAVEDRDKEIPF